MKDNEFFNWLWPKVKYTNNHPSTYAHQLIGKILAGKLLSVY